MLSLFPICCLAGMCVVRRRPHANVPNSLLSLKVGGGGMSWALIITTNSPVCLHVPPELVGTASLVPSRCEARTKRQVGSGGRTSTVLGAGRHGMELCPLWSDLALMVGADTSSPHHCLHLPISVVQMLLSLFLPHVQVKPSVEKDAKAVNFQAEGSPFLSQSTERKVWG